MEIEWINGELPDFSEALQEQLVPKLRELGEAQIANIQRRASMGLGVDDRAMPPKRDGSIRTLRSSGQMLQSMRVTPIESDGESLRVRIIFSGAEALRRAQKNQARTPFFGISPSDAETLRAIWQQR